MALDQGALSFCTRDGYYKSFMNGNNAHARTFGNTMELILVRHRFRDCYICSDACTTIDGVLALPYSWCLHFQCPSSCLYIPVEISVPVSIKFIMGSLYMIRLSGSGSISILMMTKLICSPPIALIFANIFSAVVCGFCGKDQTESLPTFEFLEIYMMLLLYCSENLVGRSLKFSRQRPATNAITNV